MTTSGRLRNRSFQVDRSPAGARAGFLLGPYVDGCQERHGNKEPGDDPGKEKFTDRLFGDDAENDQKDAWRDHTAEGPDCGHDARGKFLAVIVAIHFRDGHAGKRRCRGCSRPAERLERGCPSDGRHGQPARYVADKRVGRIVESLGDARVECDLSHQNEDGEDRVTVRCKDFDKVFCDQVHGCLKRDEVGEPQKADQYHGKGEFNARKKQDENRCQTDASGDDLIHGRLRSCPPTIFRMSQKSTTERTKKQNPTP